MSKRNKPQEISTENSWHYRYSPSFRVCRRALKDLKRFRNLVWHYYGYAGDMLENPELVSIEKLIKDYSAKRHFDLKQREINKMIPTISRRFAYVGAPTNYKFRQYGEVRSLDILFDIFHDADFCHQLRYETLIETIYRVEGYYEYSAKSIRRGWLNPISWLAKIINLPVAIMMYAGVNVESEKTSSFHYWFLQILVGILLTLLIVKLGLSVNISELVTHL